METSVGYRKVKMNEQTSQTPNILLVLLSILAIKFFKMFIGRNNIIWRAILKNGKNPSY